MGRSSSRTGVSAGCASLIDCLICRWTEDFTAVEVDISSDGSNLRNMGEISTPRGSRRMDQVLAMAAAERAGEETKKILTVYSCSYLFYLIVVCIVCARLMCIVCICIIARVACIILCIRVSICEY